MGLADQVRPSVPKDIVKELGPAGVACLLQIMADAYLDLKARRWVRMDSSEDSITEEWYVYVLERWKQTPAISCFPIHQKQDTTRAKTRGRPPTVDFCFRDCFDACSYFGAECKLLDGGNETHLAAYLDRRKGIGRLLDGRYSAASSAGAMVGYVRTGECETVAASLKQAMTMLEETPSLQRSALLSRLYHLYESRHNRPSPLRKFLCYHFLLGFEASN